MRTGPRRRTDEGAPVAAAHLDGESEGERRCLQGGSGGDEYQSKHATFTTASPAHIQGHPQGDCNEAHMNEEGTMRGNKREGQGENQCYRYLGSGGRRRGYVVAAVAEGEEQLRGGSRKTPDCAKATRSGLGWNFFTLGGTRLNGYPLWPFL